MGGFFEFNPTLEIDFNKSTQRKFWRGRRVLRLPDWFRHEHRGW